ncbi:hypothetical protein IMSAGC011_02175 [Lachnospiraceae bacterium]|nr:hypothetical protein IMSAGC011_02175 [Lachnospiraceae bacterium]
MIVDAGNGLDIKGKNMLQQLGIMLFEEREKMGVKQRNIADGIISIPELCRVERGELEIDYFTLQALFERLGKSIDKLELAVSSIEYDSIAYRIKIEHSIARWDYQELQKLIADYSGYNNKKRPIHKQYVIALEAVLCFIKEQDYAACLHKMEQALVCTQDRDWNQKIWNVQCLCNQEVRIILVIAYCQWKLGNTDGLTGKLEKLVRYIIYHYTDTEEQVKVYPHCAWLLGQIYLEENKIEEAYAICRKGKESLVENGSISPLWEILELEKNCLERLGKEAEQIQCRKYQEALSFLYEVTNTSLESNMIVNFIKSSFQGEFIITNELVRDLREANRFSQEFLCENICAQETLSKIENGKRSPNKKNLYKLLKKMGLERENYYGFIEADKYELYEKVREYNRCFSKGQLKEARNLLDKIEKELDMTRPVNKQYIGMGHIFEQASQNKISRKDANKQLKEMLYLTMPPMKSDKLIYRMPFRTEYTIWNHIAVNLRKDGKIEDALHIYEALIKCYKRSKIDMRFHAVPGMSLYINYAGFLEAHNELQKAEDIGKEGLSHCLKCCRGDVAGTILANLSLIYEKKGLPVLEETYLRHGYYLSYLYGRNNNLEILQKAYQDKFLKKI